MSPRSAERHPSEQARPGAPALGAPPSRVDPAPNAAVALPFHKRYVGSDRLGRGGMDDVLLCRDEHVGRRVAMKIIDADRGTLPHFRARFLREARIQGQLEHPSVVPVYDLGVDPEGREYFTMKHVSGVTLGNVLGALMSGDPGATERFPQSHLLQIFRTLCEVVEYAHARGVIHRDIKPSNVMIGDFGEIYLLDWGLAKTIDEEAIGTQRGHVTAQGEVMGTPGYMPPEQLISAHSVDRRGDVYSLGAILFEILALEQLHVGTSVTDVVRSTQCGVDARPSERSPHLAIAPELDSITVRATATRPDDRFENAGELRKALDQFLEGGRDLKLRGELAKRHEEAAKKALSQVIHGDDRTEDMRTVAVREAGKALALNPESTVAQRILATVLVEPPEEMPPVVKQNIKGDGIHEIRSVGTIGGIAYLAFAGCTAFVLWAGVRSWVGFAGMLVPLLAASACAFNLKRAPTARNVVFMMLFASIAIAFSSGLFGALILVPTFAAANGLVISFNHFRNLRRLYLALGLGALVIPAVLEWIGLLPPSYLFADGAMVVLPVIENFPEFPIRVGLLLANLGAIAIPILVAWRQSDALLELERDMHLTAWHLRRIVPRDEAAPSRPAG